MFASASDTSHVEFCDVEKEFKYVCMCSSADDVGELLVSFLSQILISSVQMQVAEFSQSHVLKWNAVKKFQDSQNFRKGLQLIENEWNIQKKSNEISRNSSYLFLDLD